MYYTGRVIGYREARNLMRQLDWKMLATVRRRNEYVTTVEQVMLYHPKQTEQHKARIDSGIKLWHECREIKMLDHRTQLLCYDWPGSNPDLI